MPVIQAHHADMAERLGGESGVMAKLADAMGELEKVSRKCNVVEDASKDAVQRLLERFEQNEDAQEDKDMVMEQRFQSMVMEVSENSADQHERMAKTVEQMMGRADELAQTAQRMAVELKLQAGKALDAQDKAAASTMEQGRLVCSIADSHKRDIERVCRDAECGRVLESLVTQIEIVELMRTEATAREKADSRLGAAHQSVVAEIKDEIVPRAVGEQVGEMVSLKLLPVEYEVKRQGALIEEQRVHNEARDKELEQQLGELKESHEAADSRLVALESGAPKVVADLERIEMSIGERVERIKKEVGALGTRTEADAVSSAMDGMVSLLESQCERSELEQNIGQRLAETEGKISKLDEIVTLLAQGDQDQDANGKALDSLGEMVEMLSERSEKLEERMGDIEKEILGEGSHAEELETVDEGDERGSSRGSEALSPSNKGGGKNQFEQSIAGNDSADANMWGDADGDAALAGSGQGQDGVQGGDNVDGERDGDDAPPDLPGDGDSEAVDGGDDAPPDLPVSEEGGPPDLPGAEEGSGEKAEEEAPPDLPGSEEGGPPDLPGAEEGSGEKAGE